MQIDANIWLFTIFICVNHFKRIFKTLRIGNVHMKVVPPYRHPLERRHTHAYTRAHLRFLGLSQRKVVVCVHAERATGWFPWLISRVLLFVSVDTNSLSSVFILPHLQQDHAWFFSLKMFFSILLRRMEIVLWFTYLCAQWMIHYC